MYGHWSGKFYPKNLPRDGWLAYYAKHFNTVELNTSFYHLPTPESFDRWHENTPANFIFAVKGSRYITHTKKLNDIQDGLNNFFASASYLYEKNGLILWQLPPGLKLDLARLRNFIGLLPKKKSYAFEFRNSSWYSDEVLNLLEDNNIALCLHDHRDGPSPVDVTAGFIYIRFHGPNGFYGGSYSDEILTDWALRINEWCSSGRMIYAYFNNDSLANAIKDAQRLINLTNRTNSRT